jgi:hypothetical protein
VLVLDDGGVIKGSEKIAAWARANLGELKRAVLQTYVWSYE